MFERFSDDGRRCLVMAQEEARRLHHDHIGTGHLLLGVLGVRDGRASSVLLREGATLEAARSAVVDVEGGVPVAAGPAVPFAAEAKKALEQSAQESQRFGHSSIGSEHLLIGLLRDREGRAVQVLGRLGIDPDRVCEDVVTLIWDGDLVDRPAPRGPNCPSCRLELAGHVAYRVLPVAPASPADGADALRVAFVYCVRCGAVIAHTPDGPAGN